ncbi:MAG: hypothetical protein AAF438_21715 [Pseudomonadota bacterium]
MKHLPPSSEEKAKINSEINQCRQRQFTLALAAIATVGASSLLSPQHEMTATRFTSAFAALFVLLTIMFWFSMALRRTIASLSQYLQYWGSSFETQFQLFARLKGTTYLSMTLFVAVVYLTLGLLLALSFLTTCPTGKIFGSSVSPHVLAMSGFAFFALSIIAPTVLRHRHEDNAKKQWLQLLGDSNRDAETAVQ